jgi:penicillin-binding protein 1A
VFPLVPLVFIVGIAVALYVAYRQIDLPDALPPIRTSSLYASDGTLLTELHGSVDRKIVPLPQISENLQHAVLATEDAQFYSHPGVDVKGILGAAFQDLVRRDVVAGGSTLTQQLVKNVYAGTYVQNENGTTDYVQPPRTVKEKIREALLAIKLEKTLTKDQILAKYLNTVYFGHGAYGAEAAAQTYFGKKASKLTVSESAVLAAVLHAPSLYDPIKSTYDNKFRRDYTLDLMARDGYITSQEAEELKAEECCGIPESQQQADANIDTPYGSQYFVDYARRSLFDKYGSARVYGGGLQVTSTLDMQLQKFAYEAVRGALPLNSDPQGALVSIDVRTGDVLAMVGGRSWERSKVNLATMQGGGGRQAGSAFKPITLASALEQDYSLNEYWQGPATITITSPECGGIPWEVTNAGDSNGGTLSLLSATTHSTNTVYAQLISQLGPESVATMAGRLGIRSEIPPLCAITLGSVAVNPLEMTNVYATLANHGVLNEASPLGEVVAPNGKEVTSPPMRDAPTPKIAPEFADQVTYALKTVVSSGTGIAAGIYPYPAAGKTGSAKNNVDAWFCGYTTTIATCVWVGYPKEEIPLLNVEGTPVVYGGTIPATIWHNYMLQAMEYRGEEPEDFVYPSSFTGYKGPYVPVTVPTLSPTPSPIVSVTPTTPPPTTAPPTTVPPTTPPTTAPPTTPPPSSPTPKPRGWHGRA